VSTALLDPFEDLNAALTKCMRPVHRFVVITVLVIIVALPYAILALLFLLTNHPLLAAILACAAWRTVAFACNIKRDFGPWVMQAYRNGCGFLMRESTEALCKEAERLEAERVEATQRELEAAQR
jgi:hypothetical protein